jgi:uncharacterized protein YdaU (DUF1376 family)
MSLDELGAFILLLMEAWLDGGSLPSSEIRSILKVEDEDIWQRINSNVIQRMFSKDGDRIFNETQKEIIRNVKARIKRCSNGGKIGAGSRWKRSQEPCPPHDGSHNKGDEGAIDLPQDQQVAGEVSPPATAKTPTPAPVPPPPDPPFPFIPSPTKDRVAEPQPVTSGTAKNPRKFAPPTLEEVSEHIKAKGYLIDPEAFIAFYQSKGWKVGDQPMKCWKSAVVTWAKRRPAEPILPGLRVPVSDEYRNKLNGGKK